MNWSKAKAPIPKKSADKYQHHESVFADPFAWFRDPNWQDVVRDPSQLDQKIRQHLQQENQYTKDLLRDTSDLKCQILSELKGRIAPDDRSVPMKDGPWFYNTRFTAKSEHPLFIRNPLTHNGKPDLSKEQILFDANLAAKEHDFFDLGALDHSPDHNKVAWSQDVHGSEFFEIFIRDLKTGKTDRTGITSAAGDVLWQADSLHILWIWRDENSRPKQVRRHKIGTSPDRDCILYEEDDDGFFLNLNQTSDRKFALIECRDHQTSEIHYLPLDDISAKPKCLWPRTIGIEVEAEHKAGEFTLLTNANNAPDFQLIRKNADLNGASKDQTLVAHRPGTLILDQLQFANFHVRLERKNALPQIIIRTESDGSEYTIKFEQAAYSLDLIAGYEFDSQTLRFAYSSPATPNQIFDYDMLTHQRTLLKQTEIPSGHNLDDYRVERLFAPAKDGEMIPITLLQRADTPNGAKAPLVLYGYGAYGNSTPAGFSANRLSLVDRGVGFAIAHVRGGKEKGFYWYDKGRREHKSNSFDDFISCAEFLIDREYASSGNIVAFGGSAGGMLVGAALNLRPELFAGIVAQVPFVDVLTTMCDPNLPLTPPEWPEWGNPIKSSKDFETIAAYCPIRNVKNQSYPPVLATAGLTDTRVTWWEPAKWIATLRDIAPDGGPYLLTTEMSAGHGGASGRYSQLDETALIQAFILKVLAKKQPT